MLSNHGHGTRLRADREEPPARPDMSGESPQGSCMPFASPRRCERGLDEEAREAQARKRRSRRRPQGLRAIYTCVGFVPGVCSLPQCTLPSHKTWHAAMSHAASVSPSLSATAGAVSSCHHATSRPGLHSQWVLSKWGRSGCHQPPSQRAEHSQGPGRQAERGQLLRVLGIQLGVRA